VSAQPAAVQPFASAPAVQPFVSAPVQQAPVQQPVVEPAPLPEMPQPAGRAGAVRTGADTGTCISTGARAGRRAAAVAGRTARAGRGSAALGGTLRTGTARAAAPRGIVSCAADNGPGPKQEAAPAQPRPAAGSLAPYPEWAQITQKLQEVDPMLYSYLRKSKAYFDGTRCSSTAARPSAYSLRAK